MRQVPYYLIIGNGRVARHFQYYLSLLNLKFSTWSRGQPIDKLAEFSRQASHILILIHDKAIDTFYLENLKNTSAICIHFSGSLISSYVYGAHPLMTFNKGLYTLEEYVAIPFMIDHDTPEFERLLPGLSNPNRRLSKDLKAKYHALCVLSGNFSCLLWKKFFNFLEDELNIPSLFAHPYLSMQTKNILDDVNSALTGPLVRGDTQTISNNIKALEEDAFKEVYRSFVDCYQKIIGEVAHEYS